MKVVSSKIDWLTFTKKMDKSYETPKNQYVALALAENIMSDIIGNGDFELSFDRQEGFYPWVFKVEPIKATIAISADVCVQGVRIVFPGRACQDEMQLSAWLMAIKAWGWNCTRMDVAVDVVGAVDMWDKIEETLGDLAVLKGRTIGGFRGKAGTTVYVGSRNSTNYFRAYDKGMEQKVDYSWTRCELEMKSDVANMIWQSDGYILNNAISHMAGWLEGWTHPLYEDILSQSNGMGRMMRPGRKTITDRERWLNASVLPALKSFAEDEPEAAAAWLEKAKALLDAVELMR